MHVKLANGLTRHNWRANGSFGDGLHWDNRIDPRKRGLSPSDCPEHAVDLGERIIANSLTDNRERNLDWGRVTAHSD
jgi:hypothetical protein